MISLLVRAKFCFIGWEAWLTWRDVLTSQSSAKETVMHKDFTICRITTNQSSAHHFRCIGVRLSLTPSSQFSWEHSWEISNHLCLMKWHSDKIQIVPWKTKTYVVLFFRFSFLAKYFITFFPRQFHHAKISYF